MELGAQTLKGTLIGSSAGSRHFRAFDSSRWSARGVVEAILVPEAIGMWLIRLVGTIRRWYHGNDEIYLSDAYRQQRGQVKLDFYAHVWYPSS